VTEAEWLEENDVEPMLEVLVEKLFPEAEPCNWKEGERKKRLFVCACVRRIWQQLPNEYKAFIEAVEDHVDEKVSHSVVSTCWTTAEEVQSDHSKLLFAIGYDDLGLLSYYVSNAIAAASASSGTSVAPDYQKENASLIRDIFGNPFRPVRLNHYWLTSTVLALAQGIYAERAFDPLPILADALQDAGCDNDDLLTHLRGDGPHVLGCWALDLVLGKK
jgi:hypothetical protein